MENNDILEYKNQSLFYTNLYTRLFDLIDDLIDEKNFNILKLKNTVIDFFDSYSYYLMKKKLVSREDVKLEKEDIIKMLKQFDTFTESLNKYPSEDYLKVRFELAKQDFNLMKLNNDRYNLLMREYYTFFDDVLIILKDFVDVCSVSGFLPNIKTKSALKSIGYANFNEFFKRLELLKLKLSDLTSNVKLTNVFKSRRCAYSILVIFSPYFKRMSVYEELLNSLDFEFINSDSTLKDLKKSLEYDSNKIPLDLKGRIDNSVLNNLKESVSLIKRYISYELGERDMSPKIKKKYAYDPTGV